MKALQVVRQRRDVQVACPVPESVFARFLRADKTIPRTATLPALWTHTLSGSLSKAFLIDTEHTVSRPFVLKPKFIWADELASFANAMVDLAYPCDQITVCNA